MLRIVCVLLLAVSLSGIAGALFEADCAESCDAAESSCAPECQDCFCCVSIRCLLPDLVIGEADRADVPFSLPDFRFHTTAYPREISHVPRPSSH